MVADGEAGVVDEGIGPVVGDADHALAGTAWTARSISSTRPSWCQAPAGATEADVVVVLQALLDRHAMLRLRVDDDGAGGWSLTGARGRVRRRARVPAHRWMCSPMRRWWRRGRG